MADSIEFDTSQADALFKRLAAQLTDMTPVMAQIGEILIASTKERFARGVAPDGAPWAPNAAATLARKRGTKPLIGDTKALSTTIFYENDATSVSWGSGLIYAAVQQFGAGKGVFGTAANGSPIPWGNIPARPYIGVSASDEAGIIATLEAFLTDD